MTEVEEAHRLLGLEWPTTAASLRAAYLRALRVTKPDRDPEGFKKLRTAYELLLRWLEAGAPTAAPQPAEVPSAPPESGEWWEVELRRIGDQPLRALQRIELLEAVLQARPELLELYPRLLGEYLAAGHGEPARELLLEIVRALEPQSSRAAQLTLLECWRLMVHSPPFEGGNALFLRLEPRGATISDYLAVARWLMARRDPFSAGAMLRTRLASSSAPLTSDEAERAIELAHQLAAADWSDLAHQLGLEILARAPSPNPDFQAWVAQRALKPTKGPDALHHAAVPVQHVDPYTGRLYVDSSTKTKSFFLWLLLGLITLGAAVRICGR